MIQRPPAPGWLPPGLWHGRGTTRDYVRFQQAPHSCGSAQSADPGLGPVAGVGEPIHSSAGSPWIPWFCSPRTSSKLLHPSPPPAPLRPKPSRYCRQGWDGPWAEQRVLLMESFPLQPVLARPRAAVPDVTQQTMLPEAPRPCPAAGSCRLRASHYISRQRAVLGTRRPFFPYLFSFLIFSPSCLLSTHCARLARIARSH